MDDNIAVAEAGLHAAEESLFERWSAGKTSFVPDGVVDEGAYAASAPKLLYLLKEANRQIAVPEQTEAREKAYTWAQVVFTISGFEVVRHN